MILLPPQLLQRDIGIEIENGHRSIHLRVRARSVVGQTPTFWPTGYRLVRNSDKMPAPAKRIPYDDGGSKWRNVF
jgi:hypothetical protein